MAEDDCKSCGAAGTVLVDPSSGLLCCCDCGVVAGDEMLSSEHQEGMVADRGGVLVTGNKGGWSHRFLHSVIDGSSSDRWKSKKKSDSLAAVADLVSLLGLQPNHAVDVQATVSAATAGEWGSGRWIRLLVAACVYLVVRQNHVPLTLVEIASAAGCGVPELGKMFNRVVNVLEISLPQEDMSVFLERLMSRNPLYSTLGRGKVKEMLSQCRVLLQWVERWYITTGRHRFPVVAAVMKVVSEANGVKAELDEISDDLNAHRTTARKRYREVAEACVSTVKKFTWGKGVTVRNVACHYGFVLRYLDSSLKLGKRKREDEGEWGVSAKAFVASESARCRRLGKVERAVQRIAKAKQALSGEGSGVGDEEGGVRSGLDWEDMTIEYLLLRGAAADEIEQGYYESLIAALDKPDEDEEVCDEEISKYLYSKEEILELIRRVKLQNMMSLPWVN